MDRPWIEVAAGVFARRYPELDQTLGLIVGGERCLVVDSGTDEVHGAQWLAAIRQVTALPCTVLVTHAHWDHFLGTAAFTPCPVWAHQRCRDEIATNAEEHRAEALRNVRDQPDGATTRADRIRQARVVVPAEVLTAPVELDLGGRTVLLWHPGRGHTAGDVVAEVPDARVIFAGDLVEQGAPPAIGADAYPLDWPSTVYAVLARSPEVVVPGHGEPVDPAFVASQRDELAVVASLVRAVRAGELTVDQALARSPYPAEHTRPALAGYN
jgi:glyoxylase-like metal-dependent hydrolase (beta-lactamase superfamily II)